MSTRQGSLPYVVITAALTIGFIGFLWGLLDTGFVGNITAQAGWSNGSQYSTLARTYVLQAWQWLLLIVLLRIGLEALVASRLVSTTGGLISGSFALLAVHLILVLWAFLFPQMIEPMANMALDSSAVSNAGFAEGVSIAYEFGVSYGPALIAVGADIWYLSAPIRNDAYGGIR